MAKLTKKQRRKLKKTKRAETKSRKLLKLARREKEPKAWVAPKMKMFQFPSLVPPEMSREERIELIRSIGAKARKDFDEKYPLIEKWFQEYDSLYLLSYCSRYFVAQIEGIDPEAFGKLEFYHHYLEIMQAFALRQPRNYEPKPLMQEGERLKKDMKEIGDLINIRLVDIPTDLKTDEEIHAYRLRTEMMTHTTAVRNWAYIHQMKRVSLDLSTLIRDDFKKVYGVDPVALMELFFTLTYERNDLLNEHADKLRNIFRQADYKDIISAYNNAFPKNDPIEGPGIDSIWEVARKSKRNLTGMLLCHSDLRLEEIYSFKFEHAKSIISVKSDEGKLRSILDSLSYSFGDLKDADIEHLILNNPIHKKPFIKIDQETYYSAIWGIIPHLSLGILEDLIWNNEDLRDKYSHIKSQYLEEEIERIFKAGFPNAKVFRGSIWKDPTTGVIYENDLIVVIDTFAIIVEAKSALLTDPAKRGAPKRLFETLKELLENPSEQALRFINHLTTDKKEHIFQNKRGEKNKIDTTKIDYYIPLGVTFSHLGSIGSNLKKIIEAKIVDKTLEELAPSINFTDLETLF